MLLLLKCFDIKKVKSLNDLVIIDWVLGGKPTTTTKKKALNSRSGFKSQAVPDLKQRVGLHQARVAHHLILGPDTGSNYGGRQITKKLFLPTLI